MSVLALSKRIGWGLLLLGVIASPVHGQGQGTGPSPPAQPCGIPERVDALEARARGLDDKVKALEAGAAASDPGRADPRLWISVLAVGIALALAWGARGYFDARAEVAAVPLKLVDALAKKSPGGTIDEVLAHLDRVKAKLPLVREQVETLQKALELERTPKGK